jgi:hypothetical protein
MLARPRGSKVLKKFRSLLMQLFELAGESRNFFSTNFTSQSKNIKLQKQSTAGIRWWSPTQLLACQHND